MTTVIEERKHAAVEKAEALRRERRDLAQRAKARTMGKPVVAPPPDDDGAALQLAETALRAAREVRSLAMMFVGLMMGVAAISTMTGCTPTTSAGQPYACPAGVPWVPGGYANGKFVPAHCQGEPAK